MRTEETAVLVRRMQLGDETAFDGLFAAYQQEAVRTAALITGDHSLAEDIAQETFVQCLLHIRDLQEAERFRSWVPFLVFQNADKMCMENHRQKTAAAAHGMVRSCGAGAPACI